MQAAAVQEWKRAEAASQTRLLRLFPSLTDFAFLFPAVIIFGFLKGSGMLFFDGDTGWHIRTGQWILDHHAVPRFDLFSYTKPHAHWFAWEWGWDAIFGGIERVWGLAGVAFVTVVLLCTVSMLLYRLVRRECGNDLAALAFTGLAMLASANHWLARPHLVSWLFALIFCHVVARAEAGNRRLLWWLPVLTIAWTNLHGAFLVGVIVLLASALGEAIEAFAERAAWPVVYAGAAPYLWCALGCFAATFVNPYGWRLHQHLFGYLADSKLLDRITEFQSPNFRQPDAIFFEIMLLAGIASLARCWRRKRYAAAILIVLWAHMALLSARNIAFFAFFAAPFVAATACGAARRLHRLPVLGTAAHSFREISRELRPLERVGRLYLMSGLAVFLIACGFLLHIPKFDSSFSSKHFPVAAVPALEAAHSTRLFTTDRWADYLIYRLYPSIRVFADGRSDFYGPVLMTRYLDLIEARYDWRSQLQDFGIDAVLVSPNCPLSTVLKEAPGWRVLYDDGSAILFQRVAGRVAGLRPAMSSFVATSAEESNRQAALNTGFAGQGPALQKTFQAERSLQTGRPTSYFIASHYERRSS